MATTKPKKTPAKKTSQKSKSPEKSAKTTKAEKSTKPVVKAAITSKPASRDASCDKFFGIFSKKYDPAENILTIFKNNKIWGAVLGEVVGTMLLTILLLMFGANYILYIMVAIIGIVTVIHTISGAHLNPVVTAGMMVTRRVSAIRGVIYIVAQIVGAWLAVLVLGAFRSWGGDLSDIPTMTELTTDAFWVTAALELFGASIIGFFFARALEFKRSALTFGVIVGAGIVTALVSAFIISGNFLGASSNFILNPALALMMQIFPTAGESVGEVLGGIGLALATYVIFPVIGGIIGFIIADLASKLSNCGCEAKN